MRARSPLLPVLALLALGLCAAASSSSSAAAAAQGGARAIPAALLDAYAALGQQLKSVTTALPVGAQGQAQAAAQGQGARGERPQQPATKRQLSPTILRAICVDAISKARRAFSSTISSLPASTRQQHALVATRLAAVVAALEQNGFGDSSARAMQAVARTLMDTIGDSADLDAAMWTGRLLGPSASIVAFVEDLHNFVATTSNSTLIAYTAQLCDSNNSQPIAGLQNTIPGLLGLSPALCHVSLWDRITHPGVAAYFLQSSPASFVTYSSLAAVTALSAFGARLLHRVDELRKSDCTPASSVPSSLSFTSDYATGSGAASPTQSPSAHFAYHSSSATPKQLSVSCPPGDTCSVASPCGGCQVCAAGVGFAHNTPSEVQELTTFVNLVLQEEVGHANSTVRDAIEMITLAVQAAHPMLYVKTCWETCEAAPCCLGTETRKMCVPHESEWIAISPPSGSQWAPLNTWTSEQMQAYIASSVERTVSTSCSRRR